ncbi:hypothetical protein [Pseudoalteromonas sp. R3]|uniref:hypothetical protein n=1 Tax=Pseudoalteromonas sp. R3 TaxID=1709477 RepID=UPI0006B5DC29|nr:hypothetical protein [Pseudoalteromonas sp. R3]
MYAILDMRKILLFFIVLSFNTFSGTVPNCSENELFGGKLFELEVVTSFHGSYNFKFCFDETSYVVSQYIEPVSTRGPLKTTITHESLARLDVKTSLYIKDLYRAVQATLVTDSVRGMDGSTWCFKPKSGSSYSETCLWTPNAAWERRNLGKLVELGDKLFEISNFASLEHSD